MNRPAALLALADAMHEADMPSEARMMLQAAGRPDRKSRAQVYLLLARLADRLMK